MRTFILLVILSAAFVINGCKSCTKKNNREKTQEKEQIRYEQPDKKTQEPTDTLTEKKEDTSKKLVETKKDTQTTKTESPKPEQTTKPENIRKMLKAKYRQINVGPYARFYKQEYPGGKSILWVSSLDRVSKIDVTEGEFKLINQLPIVGTHYFSDKEIDNLNGKINDATNIKELIKLREEIFGKYSIKQPTLSLMHENGYLYIAYGQRIYAFGDEQERFSASAAEMKLSYKISKKILKSDNEHIIAFAKTPKKKFVFVTNKGTIGLINNDLRKPVHANIPEDELYSYELAFDNSNGIYITSDKAIYRFVEGQDEIITTGNNSFRFEHGETAGAVPGPPLLININGRKRIIFIAGKEKRKLIAIDITKGQNKIVSTASLGRSLLTEKYKKNYHVNKNTIIVFNNRLINNKTVAHIESYKLDPNSGNLAKQWAITKENIFSFPTLLDNKKIMAATMENNMWDFEFIDFNNGAILEYISLKKQHSLLPASPQLLTNNNNRLFYSSPMRLTEMKIEN
jgi:hypothetical protein